MDAKMIGELIANLRKEKGMSQKELANKLNVTNKAISRWETGRGYPDIESLPILAQVLEISINELLNGEKLQKSELAESADRNLTYVCQSAGKQKQKYYKIIIAMALVMAILLTLVLYYGVYPHFAAFYEYVVGSDLCVVAYDYSSLTYYDQKYVPLPMNGYECQIGELLIQEAKVEGIGIIDKLFFGDSVYEVKGVPDYELIYLQTDMDSKVSAYFVLESEFDKYYQMLTDGDYSYYYTQFEQVDGILKELPVNVSAVDAILSAEKTGTLSTDIRDEWEAETEWIDIHAYEKNHLFYRREGDLWKTGQGYYWHPYVYKAEWDRFMMSHQYYLIDEYCYDVLKELFVYTNIQ